MPIQVRGVLLHTMSGTELSRVPTESRDIAGRRAAHGLQKTLDN
jgi:hypothetical protein